MSGFSGKTGLLAALLAILSLLSIILHRVGLLIPAENVVLQAMVPVQRVISGTAGAVLDALSILPEATTLREENRRLRQEVEELRARVVSLQEAERENRNLREQLGFKQAYPAYDLLPAEVVGRDPSNYLRFLVIDKGSDDGVRLGAVVVVPQGLVGRVVALGSNFSKVMLITDPSSSVNVLLQSSRATGVAAGQMDGSLLIKYIPQGEILHLGDMVLTSGLGGNFPKGLIVGQVTQVKRKDIELFQEAQAESLIDFRHLEVVYVIRNFVPQRLE